MKDQNSCKQLSQEDKTPIFECNLFSNKRFPEGRTENIEMSENFLIYQFEYFEANKMQAGKHENRLERVLGRIPGEVP